MNPLLKSNPTLIYNEYEKTGKLKLPAPYAKNHKLFIDHLLPVLAKVKLWGKGKISMQKTLRNIPTDGIEDFSFNDIRALILIAARVPRSALVSNMAKNPKYGSLTPLFMYAHKLYNNVSYDFWEANDPMIELAIGTFLNKALDFQKEFPDILDIESHVRKAIAPTPYTKYPTYLNHTITIEATEDPAYIIEYPKEWVILNAQFWIANAELRDTETMLLDIKSFGRIPKALDVKGVITEEVVQDNTNPLTCEW